MKRLFIALNTWLNTRPYTKAMYISAIATLAMAVLSGIMCYTIYQNAQSLRIAEESLSLARESVLLQRQEVQLRNRPVILLRDAKLINTSDIGVGPPASTVIEVSLQNVTDIPANQVTATYRVAIKGRPEWTGNWNIHALAREHGLSSDTILNKGDIEALNSHGASLQVFYRISYGGMLGEEENQYTTSGEIYYVTGEKQFKFRATEFN